MSCTNLPDSRAIENCDDVERNVHESLTPTVFAVAYPLPVGQGRPKCIRSFAERVEPYAPPERLFVRCQATQFYICNVAAHWNNVPTNLRTTREIG